MTVADLASAGESAGKPRPSVSIWILGALTLTGSLAMHIFVPALPAAGAELHAGAGEMQFAISLYIVGMAFGQLLYGPLSDRLGRRPVLIGGLTLYILAGIVCWMAQDVRLLLVTRLFQALGGCAGLVLGRAILRDTSDSSDIPGRLAILTMVMVIGPALAPLIGGWIAQFFGWRAIFPLLIAIGLLNIAAVLLVIPETRPESAPRGSFLTGVKVLLGIPAFRWLVLGSACATTSMYGVIAVAPFVFEQDLHRPAHEVGPWLAAVVFAVALGNMVIRFSHGRLPLRRLLVVANLATLASGLAMVAIVLFTQLTAFGFIAPLFVFCIATGVTGPIATTEALSLRPELAGAASGLYGFSQMAVAALCTVLTGLGSDPALSAGLLLAAVGVVAMTAFRMAARAQR